MDRNRKNKMKKILLILLTILTLQSHGATITRGYTFSTNEIVTAAKLHTLVDSATISTIATADISALAINNGLLGANAVTTDKILDAKILGADIANLTLTGGLMVTGTVTAVQLSTNLNFGAGYYAFTNNPTTVNFGGANTSLIFSNASSIIWGTGQIPISTISGLFLSSIVQTNFTSASGGVPANTWVTIATLTTTKTNGTVTVMGSAGMSTLAGSDNAMRIMNTNLLKAGGINSQYLLSGPKTIACTAVDSITNVTTYTLDVSSGAGSQTYTNLDNTAPGITNALYFKLIQIP